MNDKYGNCNKCNSFLEPVWFREEEIIVRNGIMYKTGRVRKSCSHLQCPSCLKKVCVDSDTFSEEWYYF